MLEGVNINQLKVAYAEVDKKFQFMSRTMFNWFNERRSIKPVSMVLLDICDTGFICR
ncbi:hypothetical protein SAMN05216239_2280 [Bacillus amyloliquefaciens]|nr:hypothetical protein SAMN05216239_2280 [Bacillus amyloliquefaciens]